MKKNDGYKKPNPLVYELVRFSYRIYVGLHVHHRYIRNEAKKIEGPAVYLGTHVSSFEHGVDSNSVRSRMNYVAAESTYYTVLTKLMRAIGVIPKQQFYSNLQEFKAMRDVIKNKGIICIYPAGICTADGKNTPLPKATAKWLKSLGADVYVAKHNGFYLSCPKWSDHFFKGPVETDICQLFSKEDLKNIPLSELESQLEKAMEYDDYLWQEQHHYRYKNIQPDGLENVLYSCPKCHHHFSIELTNHKLVCSECGYTKEMDEYGFLKANGEDTLKYPPEWRRILIDDIKTDIMKNPDFHYTSKVKISRLNKSKNRFDDIGEGAVLITKSDIRIVLENKEQIYQEECIHFFALPMIPGHYFDLQDGKTIFRCYPEIKKDVSYLTDIVISLTELRAQVK